MKNKELKKEIVNNGTFKEYSKQRFTYFENGQYDKIDNCENYYDVNGEIFNDEINLACQQIKHARKLQIKKLRDHINFLLRRNYKLYFMTFTYDDNKVKDITPEKLKRRITRTMSKNCDDYIINIDYGKEHERLHFHCIMAKKFKDDEKENLIDVYRYTKKGKVRKGKKLVEPWLKRYEKEIGFYDAEPVKDNIYSAKKLSRYIDKLTLHSLKVKQNYVSVKKGTEYEECIRLEKELRRQRNLHSYSSPKISKEINNELIEIEINNEKSIERKMDLIMQYKDIGKPPKNEQKQVKGDRWEGLDEMLLKTIKNKEKEEILKRLNE